MVYGNNNGNMVVGETLEFFQFSKSDISTARCKCAIYIFTYKGINVVITAGFMSEIELFSGELSFGAVNLCFRCSYLKIVFHSNLQSIFLNKKDETCPLVDTNLSASIELSLWSRNRKKTFCTLG